MTTYPAEPAFVGEAIDLAESRADVARGSAQQLERLRGALAKLSATMQRQVRRLEHEARVAPRSARVKLLTSARGDLPRNLHGRPD